MVGGRPCIRDRVFRGLILHAEYVKRAAHRARVARRSDILLENYKVGTLAKFELGYEDLKQINPRLVYCSVTGFGQTGPKRDAAADDFMIQAMGGLMSITGEQDDLPGWWSTIGGRPY